MQLRTAVAVSLVLYGTLAPANEHNPGKDVIQRVLLEQRHWTLIFEIGPALEPSPAATKVGHSFYLRDGRLIGEWSGRPAGYECAYEVKLRDDGFALLQCGRYDKVYTELQYDPRDARYPFKRISTPSKWWLEKNKQ